MFQEGNSVFRDIQESGPVREQLRFPEGIRRIYIHNVCQCCTESENDVVMNQAGGQKFIEEES